MPLYTRAMWFEPPTSFALPGKPVLTVGLRKPYPTARVPTLGAPGTFAATVNLPLYTAPGKDTSVRLVWCIASTSDAEPEPGRRHSNAAEDVA